MTTIIYTDGACKGNPGPGGWAYVLEHGGKVITSAGSERGTTNNRMELMGAIRGLEYAHQMKGLERARVVTDSAYLVNGITGHIHGWLERGWKTVAKKPVANQDLWERLYPLAYGSLLVTWQWVKGHAGHAGNEMADTLASRAAASCK